MCTQQSQPGLFINQNYNPNQQRQDYLQNQLQQSQQGIQQRQQQQQTNNFQARQQQEQQYNYNNINAQVSTCYFC